MVLYDKGGSRPRAESQEGSEAGARHSLPAWRGPPSGNGEPFSGVGEGADREGLVYFWCKLLPRCVVDGVGDCVGEAVCAFVGDGFVDCVGEAVGAFVGDWVGGCLCEVVGAFVGNRVGDRVGEAVVACVGDGVEGCVGEAVGIRRWRGGGLRR